MEVQKGKVMDQKQPILELGKFLKTARKKSKLSQWEVAQDLGYGSAQFISNWERGISYPPTKSLPKLCKMYGVGLDKLWTIYCKALLYEHERKLRFEYKQLTGRR